MAELLELFVRDVGVVFLLVVEVFDVEVDGGTAIMFVEVGEDFEVGVLSELIVERFYALDWLRCNGSERGMCVIAFRTNY